ncbi:MAG: M64 family metallopeptidase [Adhaeribacter sp.]
MLILTTWPFFGARGQKFKVDTLAYAGKSGEFINLVILGDGYTGEQMGNYLRDARLFSNYLFSQPPYDAYKQHFNVFAIQVISPETGVKHPATAGDCYTNWFPPANPVNFFGTTFDVGGMHRLVVPAYSNKVAKVLAENFPDYDQVVLLANTPHYGGSGGLYATATLNKSSSEIALHELGHSFGGLADEYWAGENFARERPNMTQENQARLIKWKNWLTPDTGIGIHPYGQGKWYKPSHKSCKMESLFEPHCAVCTEAIVEQIHSLSSPLGLPAGTEPKQLQVNPQTPGFYVPLEAIQPKPNTLKTTWQLNGKALAANRDSVLIVPASLEDGSNTLSVTVQDTTTSSRSELHLSSHRYERKWIIENSFVLPVEWLDFHAQAQPGRVWLTWTTASETNNAGFVVERSGNARTWKQVGQVAGQGSSQVLQHYQFEDTGPFPALPATLYYRLQQVDFNGQLHYSRLRAVELKQAGELRLLGNPVSRQLHFWVKALGAPLLRLGIYKTDGSRVLHLPVKAIAGEIKVPVAHLPPGVYIYSLFQGENLVLSGKFLKQAE